MAVNSACCALCGAPIEDGSAWPLWMQEFRAVFASNEDSSVAHLSGVGHREAFVDLIYPQASPSPDTEQVEIYLMRSSFGGPNLAVGGTGPDVWGFPFHVPCWNILASLRPQDPPNIQAIFNFLRSFPIQQGILNFGHDYDGLLQYEKVPGKVASGEEAWFISETNAVYQQHDPFDIADLRRFFENEDANCVGNNITEVHTNKPVTRGDSFSKLPTEILEYILEFLPSAYVVRLKQTSRVCANLHLPDLFWRSRFLQGQEFEFVFEPFQNDLSQKGKWKSLYVLVRTLRSQPAMVNRKRVWKLACSLRDILDRTSGNKCDGDPIQSFFETTAPSDNTRWITATRSLAAMASGFASGRRSLWERTLALPSEPATLFISGIKIFGRFYISGIDLELKSGEHCSLGYNHSEYKALCVKESVIAGFYLAQDERGVRGIAVLSTTGVLSNWIGDYQNLPKRRLVLSSTKHTAITFLKGGFDALKFVSLSISDGTQNQFGLDNTPTLRDSVSWFPDIPDQSLSFLGVKTLETAKSDIQFPLSIAAPSGRLEYHNLQHIHKVTARIGDGGNIWGLDITFPNSPHAIRLGVDGVISEEKLTLKMDPSVEHITSIDALYLTNRWLLGLKVYTNLGRIAEFPPLITQGMRSTAWHAESLRPEKGMIIGFCSRVSQWRGLNDIGLVYATSTTSESWMEKDLDM